MRSGREQSHHEPKECLVQNWLRAPGTSHLGLSSLLLPYAL